MHWISFTETLSVAPFSVACSILTNHHIILQSFKVVPPTSPYDENNLIRAFLRAFAGLSIVEHKEISAMRTRVCLSLLRQYFPTPALEGKCEPISEYVDGMSGQRCWCDFLFLKEMAKIFQINVCVWSVHFAEKVLVIF